MLLEPYSEISPSGSGKKIDCKWRKLAQFTAKRRKNRLPCRPSLRRFRQALPRAVLCSLRLEQRTGPSATPGLAVRVASWLYQALKCQRAERQTAERVPRCLSPRSICSDTVNNYSLPADCARKNFRTIKRHPSWPKVKKCEAALRFLYWDVGVDRSNFLLNGGAGRLKIRRAS